MLAAVAYEHQYGFPHFRFPALLGDASYSLYLSHGFALGAAGVLWKRAGLHSAVAFMLLAVVACLVFALAVYQWLERPMLTRLMQWIHGSARRDQVVAAQPAR